MSLFLGIDPGLSGAWALIDHDGRYVGCADVPTGNKRILVRQLWSEMVQAIDQRDVVHVCIEDVHAMPGQGVSSMFVFGRAAGAVEALVERMQCPWSLVTPSAWKKECGLARTEKDESRVLAMRRWPDAPILRKRDCGRADALWLAEYARRMEA